MERTSVSIFLKSALSTLGVVTAIGVVLSLESGALAQASRATTAPSSVLPSGGQALLDPSDTAMLPVSWRTATAATARTPNSPRRLTMCWTTSRCTG